MEQRSSFRNIIEKRTIFFTVSTNRPRRFIKESYKDEPNSLIGCFNGYTPKQNIILNIKMYLLSNFSMGLFLDFGSINVKKINSNVGEKILYFRFQECLTNASLAGR